MTLPLLRQFFMWCTVINGGLFVFWTICILAMPDWVYRTQTRFIPISRETFHVAMYGFLGLFKIFFLFFNVVPFLVLLILG